MAEAAASKIEIPLEDRYSRLRLITWWKQETIAAARVLVVGAGALGNEILKNLALVGFENVLVVDLDAIEITNLSRSILFSESEIGKPKALAAADAMKRISPASKSVGLQANVISGIGLGVFDWSDVVIGGLDNREARLWLNRACWRMNKAFIDGAIEGINGVARVFLPGKPPCYECTLGEVDWQILQHRLACNLLTRAEMESGKVPTTPTIASIIGGIQVQEALKLLHSVKTLSGEAFVFEGLNHTSYRVAYTESPDCMSHHTHADVVRLQERSSDLTVHELWSRAVGELGGDVALEFSREVIHKLVCPNCAAEEEMFAPLGTVAYEYGKCIKCGEMRIVQAIHGYTGTEPFGARCLDELGLPKFDVFVARNDECERAYLICGDAVDVLGALGREEERSHE
jgi:molybdopterin/thiamine biosynthesis adenylyltransferase